MGFSSGLIKTFKALPEQSTFKAEAIAEEVMDQMLTILEI